ncbi:hypothetical protein CsatB_008674 [Cannabis sativa]|uniref:uncharacterized mitochondrial protein AtMg00860-like n=1 Tax=Cannabis sativa TaxID=3483 RepID=UPI0011DF66ED|nr:uncharacterized mitochondrial protein AtMg00860-like [Cannabis sativa]
MPEHYKKDCPQLKKEESKIKAKLAPARVFTLTQANAKTSPSVVTDVFPDELLDLRTQREIDFVIDLAPRAEPVSFLRHIVTKDRIMVDSGKIESVRDRPRPKIVTEVKSFLGLAGYYHQFIEGFSRISTPLIELTKRNQRLLWTDKCETSFQELKQRLTTTPVLALPSDKEVCGLL